MAHRLRDVSIVAGAGLGVIVALARPTAQAPPAKVVQPAPVQAAATLDRYRTPDEIVAATTALSKGMSGRAVVHTLATSPGGRPVHVLEIGPDAGRATRSSPAVLVVANTEGTVPLATEAAVHLAETLAQKPDLSKDLTWFILPLANPDAASRYFGRPRVSDERNASRHNDDMDEATDEDGPNDLDGNGLITQMRVKDPTGEWMLVDGDPRLMKRADPAKGEKGAYRLYSEGVDDDGDGEYNEDGPGGAAIGLTFPHLFRAFDPQGGRWPGSELETLGIVEFVFAHPEIAMTIHFGSTNMSLQPPAGGRQGSVDLTSIKVPERIASRFGADPNRTYTMQEIMEMVRPMAPPGFQITESVVASFLGLGAVVNPLDEDLKVYREISDRYKEFLKAAKLDGKRLDPAQPRDGSFELWSYYHLGVPTFSLDFWTIPEAPEPAKGPATGLTPDSLEAMTNEAFVALGEEKVAAFLKEVGAPPNIAAPVLIQGVQSGRMTPKQMAGMLRQMPKPRDAAGADPKMKALVAFSDRELKGQGFVAWKAVQHPTLKEVEVGGMVPFADTTPPAEMIRTLVEGQVPWAFKLAERLPRMKIARTESVAKASGVYEVNAWIENRGYLPFPTAMGRRNQRPAPAVVTLKGSGLTFLTGRARTPVTELDGNKTVKLNWLVRVERPGPIDVSVASPSAGSDAATLALAAAPGTRSPRGESTASMAGQAGQPAATAKAPAQDPVKKTAADRAITVPLRFDRYYSYEELVEALKALNAAYPGMTSLELVGKSEEGRDIWAMTVNNPKTGEASGKPGVYVDGNIHGNEIQGGEVCLYLLNALLTRYGQNPQITKSVDRNVFYVIPSVNVDGRAHFFADANTPSSNRSMRVPRDDDRDGLVDEDGPDDLDGDGNITAMRRRDPFGQFKSDAEEPRLMVRVKPGEQGEWTLLGDEGLDNDGDGRVNEDAEGYLDGNRNWGFNWAPPYVQPGSGEYPFSAKPTRAIAKFLMARPNIIAVYAFHNNGGMFLRGPSTKAQEPLNPQDVAVYDILGRNAERIVPGYRYLVSWKDLYATYGDFTDFTYNLLGAYGFVGELFVTASETYKGPAPENRAERTDTDMFGGNLEQDRERLKFNDHVTQGDLHKTWTPFKHPVYGDIEIGGWVKLSSRLPHPFMLPDLVHRNASAVLFAAAETPDVSLDVLAVDGMGQGISRVRVRLANAGSLPTMTYNAVQKKAARKDVVKVAGAGLTVVAGGVLTDLYKDEVSYKPQKPEWQFVHVPGDGKVDLQFLVQGSGTLEIRYESTKAGTRSKTVVVP